MNIGKKIAYNSFISVFSRGLNLVASLVIIGLLTRYLGREGYGAYSTVLAFVYIFSVLADLGLYSLSVREISRPGVDEQKIIRNAFSIRFFAGLFLFVLAAATVWLLPYSETVKKGVMIASIGFWFLSNTNVLIGVFQKHLRMDKVALAEFFSRLLQLGLVWFFVSRDFGFLSFVWAMTAASFLNLILAILFLRKYGGLRLELDFVFWGKFLKQSLPLAAASVLVMVYFKLDTVMLSLMKTQDEVGLYSLAYKVLESLIFLPTMFVGLMMPFFSRFFVQSLEKFKASVFFTQKIFLIFACPLVLGGVFLSRRIILFLAGEQFVPAAWTLSILMMAVGVIFFGALYSSVLIAINRQKKLTLIYGLGAVVNLGLNFVFIPRYSYNGAALTTLFTELLVTLLMLYFFKQALKFVPSFRSFGSVLPALLLMLAVLVFLKEAPLLWLILLAGAVYFLGLWLFRGITKKELLFLAEAE